jgi:hypothetical protein
MRFVIGKPPDDPDFAPEQDVGWQRLREMGPATLLLVGSLAGVPLAALFRYAWLQVPGTDLSFRLWWRCRQLSDDRLSSSIQRDVTEQGMGYLVATRRTVVNRFAGFSVMALRFVL